MGNQATQMTQKDKNFLQRLQSVDKTVQSPFGKVILHNIVSQIEETHYIMQLQLPFAHSDSHTIARAEFYRNIQPQEAIVRVELARLLSVGCSNTLSLDLYLKYYNFTLGDFTHQKKQSNKQLSNTDTMYIFKTLATLGKHLETNHGKIYLDVFHINEFYVTKEGHVKMYPFKLEQYNGIYRHKESFENIIARKRRNGEEIFAPLSCKLDHIITNPSKKSNNTKQTSVVMPNQEIVVNFGVKNSKIYQKSSADDIFDLGVMMLEVISQTDIENEIEKEEYNHIRSTQIPSTANSIQALKTTQRQFNKSDRPMLTLSLCLSRNLMSKRMGLLLESMLKRAVEYETILKQLNEIRFHDGIKATKSIKLVQEKSNLSYSTSVQEEDLYKP